MKKLIPAFLLLTIFAVGAAAQEYVYTDATTLPVYGKICENTFEPFSRLPESMKATVRDKVWSLGRASAGIFIRFTSDAGDFNFKWNTSMNRTLDNMTSIGVKGLALYVLDKGEWMYLSSVRPQKKDEAGNYSYGVKASKLAGENREYMLYLGLYDGIIDLQIGVPAGKTLLASTLDSPRAGKPVIIYGTSILQGASASSPGLCGTAQLSRRIDRVVINLGFSGNCLLEAPLAEYMASYPDPGMFIIDNWNGAASVGEKGLENCLRILLAAHPSVPILVVDRAADPKCLFDEGSRNTYDAKVKVASDVVAKLRKEGYKKVRHITPSVLGRGNSGTADGTHFTDEAFSRWVDAILPTVKKSLR